MDMGEPVNDIVYQTKKQKKQTQNKNKKTWTGFVWEGAGDRIRRI